MNSSPIDSNELLSISGNKIRSNEVSESIQNLLEWNILSIEDRPEERIEYEYTNPFQDSVKSDIHYLSGAFISISGDCNLRCKYCSVGFGYFGKKSLKGLMSEKTAKDSVDFLVSNLKPENTEPYITFLGGEPLLNFRVMKFIVEYMKTYPSLHPWYMFNTNGTLLNDDISKWLNDNRIPINFSIDGTKEMHDSSRIFANGNGSYERVIKGLSVYQKYNGRSFTAQAAIPKANDIVDGIHDLWALGAEKVLAYMAMESVFVPSQNYEVTKKDWYNYACEMEKLNNEIIDNFINSGNSKLVQNTLGHLETLYRRSRKSRGCSIGRTVSIDINGNIYPCEALLGFEKNQIGTIYEGINTVKLYQLGEQYVEIHNKCKKCWARNICGALCMALYIQNEKNVDNFAPTRYCESVKRSIEHSVYNFNKILKKKPKLLSLLFNEN